MDTVTSIFGILILIMSVVIHEVSHGYAALFFGDHTAEVAGRLTLNPLKHIDPIGSILVPGILILSGSPFPFGWARPVPYNERNLRNPRWGTLAVASAGILANFALAIVFGIVFRIAIATGFATDGFAYIVSIIILANIGLGFFNLIPVPPLDGSKILFSLLPPSLRPVRNALERYGFVLVFILVAVLWQYDFISPLIRFLFTLLTGVNI
jgi:Zn-dependent protease